MSDVQCPMSNVECGGNGDRRLFLYCRRCAPRGWRRDLGLLMFLDDLVTLQDCADLVPIHLSAMILGFPIIVKDVPIGWRYIQGRAGSNLSQRPVRIRNQDARNS